MTMVLPKTQPKELMVIIKKLLEFLASQRKIEQNIV